MGTCCQCERDTGINEISIDKNAITKDFDYIVTSLNPFYSYNLRIIEEIERRFFLESLPLMDFIDLWLTGFLNCQVKKTFLFCKQDLDKLFNDERVSEIVFLNLLLLTLSSSTNARFKKEYVCYMIINKYCSKDIKNFTLLINSVIDLISICVKISICFVFLFFVFDYEHLDDLKELFAFNDSQSLSNQKTIFNNAQVNNENGAVSSKAKDNDHFTLNNSECKVLNFDRNRPFYSIEVDTEISIYPYSAAVKNLNILCNNLFSIISNIYSVRVHSHFEKYKDYIAGYSLKKLLYRQSDFSKIQEEEIKSIVQDIIEIISVWKLFDLMFR